MRIYPAIDLKNGQCVRLEKGALESATLYNEDPADQARLFDQAGAAWLHVVDLDGAFAGRPVNRRAVERVLSATDLKVQLGGGIRDRATIDKWLDAGVNRVVLGTAALKNPALVHQAAKDNPGAIVVAVDAKDGRVAAEGWAKTSDLSAVDLARRFEDAGVAALLFTDVSRDGVLAGVNVDATLALADAVSVPVIASGGVKDMADIEKLARASAADGSLDGVIVGRALYEGRLDLAAAIARIDAIC